MMGSTRVDTTNQGMILSVSYVVLEYLCRTQGYRICKYHCRKIIHRYRYLCTVVRYMMFGFVRCSVPVRAPLSIVSAVPAWVVEERGLGILSGEALHDIVAI